MMREKADLSIRFLGGAGTVTGSKYLLTIQDHRILVDCGLFQGVKNLRLRNWEPFPFPPSQIEAVILSHAHLDHSGYLPKLVQGGFKGAIYCTRATFELCKILLMDSAFLMVEDAEFLNRKKLSKHAPALPLYSMEDVERTLKLFVPLEFESTLELANGIKFEFRYAGHILGAASILIECGEKRILFSGDLGRQKDPIFFPPVAPPRADILVVESTYGNRPHPSTSPLLELQAAVSRVFARGGTILVPAFAVGRTQLLMHQFSALKRMGHLPAIPIFLNSPMAIDATRLFYDNHSLHRLTKQQCEEMGRDIVSVRSIEESKALNERTDSKILISASGMMTGGRILHHLKAFAGNSKNMILLTGFQAEGTRGRAIADGAQEVKIHGTYYPIRAELVKIENFSAHADTPEIIQWLESNPEFRPSQVFITHGEPAAADELRRRLNERFGWNCVVPEALSEVTF